MLWFTYWRFFVTAGQLVCILVFVIQIIGQIDYQDCPLLSPIVKEKGRRGTKKSEKGPYSVPLMDIKTMQGKSFMCRPPLRMSRRPETQRSHLPFYSVLASLWGRIWRVSWSWGFAYILPCHPQLLAECKSHPGPIGTHRSACGHPIA